MFNNEHHSLRIFHIGQYRKKQERLKNIVYFVLWHFLKPVTLSLRTISLDSLFVVKKYVYSDFGSKVKSPV